jgi:hypothetical protein
MTELQKMMFYEDVTIALIYFIGFGIVLLIGGGAHSLGNAIIHWWKGGDQ